MTSCCLFPVQYRRPLLEGVVARFLKAIGCCIGGHVAPSLPEGPAFLIPDNLIRILEATVFFQGKPVALVAKSTGTVLQTPFPYAVAKHGLSLHFGGGVNRPLEGVP